MTLVARTIPRDVVSTYGHFELVWGSYDIAVTGVLVSIES